MDCLQLEPSWSWASAAWIEEPPERGHSSSLVVRFLANDAIIVPKLSGRTVALGFHRTQKDARERTIQTTKEDVTRDYSCDSKNTDICEMCESFPMSWRGVVSR